MYENIMFFQIFGVLLKYVSQCQVIIVINIVNLDIFGFQVKCLSVFIVEVDGCI